MSGWVRTYPWRHLLKRQCHDILILIFGALRHLGPWFIPTPRYERRDSWVIIFFKVSHVLLFKSTHRFASKRLYKKLLVCTEELLIYFIHRSKICIFSKSVDNCSKSMDDCSWSMDLSQRSRDNTTYDSGWTVNTTKAGGSRVNTTIPGVIGLTRLSYSKLYPLHIHLAMVRNFSY
jgi:hypothetical protein